jgi:hypothetical protein
MKFVLEADRRNIHPALMFDFEKKSESKSFEVLNPLFDAQKSAIASRRRS